jgi:hypothetical protein
VHLHSRTASLPCNRDKENADCLLARSDAAHHEHSLGRETLASVARFSTYMACRTVGMSIIWPCVQAPAMEGGKQARGENYEGEKAKQKKIRRKKSKTKSNNKNQEGREMEDEEQN